MMDFSLLLVYILPVDAPSTALTPVAKPAEKKLFQQLSLEEPHGRSTAGQGCVLWATWAEGSKGPNRSPGWFFLRNTAHHGKEKCPGWPPAAKCHFFGVQE